MTKTPETIVRMSVTAVAVIIAILAVSQLYTYYMDAPWTRDGRVRADVIQVAPDVSGLVTQVNVHDNQMVKTGDLLFTIDRARYDLALREAETTVAMRQAQLEQALRDEDRAQTLTKVSAVSAASAENQKLQSEIARQTLAEAQVQLDTAKLNAERTEVRAPQDGMVSNFGLRAGNYAVAGKAVFALVATQSFYVSGYFEETRLARIHVGDGANIKLMGVGKTVKGHVESIAAGITDRENADSSNLLANINPTFSWVRLAQRVPVRIAIDSVPDGVTLISGQTASINIEPK